MRPLPGIEAVAAKLYAIWERELAEGTDEDLVPYDQLPEDEKGTVRALVQSVYDAVDQASDDAEVTVSRDARRAGAAGLTQFSPETQNGG